MKLKTKFKLAALTFAIGAGFATPAWSNLQFTLTPSLAVPSLTTNAGTITADTMQGFDNATITFLGGNGINGCAAGFICGSESGIVSVQSFTLLGVGLLGFQTAGINSGPIAPASPTPASWGLYFSFTATAAPVTNILSPTSVSLAYSLYGDPGSNTTFTAGGVIGGNTGVNADVLLASGVATGTAAVVGPPLNPTITVAGSFNVAPGEGSGGGTFFTDPNPFYMTIGTSATSQALLNIVSNCPTSGVVAAGASCTLQITGGGDTAGFSGVPEPETLALFGLGLLGLGFTRRKWC